VLDVPSAELGTITGFSAGNTIDVQGLLYSTAVFTPGTVGSAGTLTLSGGASDPLSLAVEGDYAPDSFIATPSTSDTIVTLIPCFVSGTRIATESGEAEVESLRTGNRVLTGSDRGCQPIVWIGSRAVDCRAHPQPNAVWPVRITTGAFGPGLPARDLRLSPDHAVFVAGVLIPVRYLLNGTTIVQERQDDVVYWHLELPRHGVLLAERLPVESYLDTGNRAAFESGGTVSLVAARA
jgi:hypothetical protein